LYFQIDDERPGEFETAIEQPINKRAQDFKDFSKVGENHNLT
jgi:hypothetical protein